MFQNIHFTSIFCETLPQTSWISCVMHSEVVAKAWPNIHTHTHTPGDLFVFYGSGLLFNIPTLL